MTRLLLVLALLVPLAASAKILGLPTGVVAAPSCTGKLIGTGTITLSSGLHC
jgi:hypothetical protein